MPKGIPNKSINVIRQQAKKHFKLLGVTEHPKLTRVKTGILVAALSATTKNQVLGLLGGEVAEKPDHVVMDSLANHYGNFTLQGVFKLRKDNPQLVGSARRLAKVLRGIIG